MSLKDAQNGKCSSFCPLLIDSRKAESGDSYIPSGKISVMREDCSGSSCTSPWCSDALNRKTGVTASFGLDYPFLACQGLGGDLVNQSTVHTLKPKTNQTPSICWARISTFQVTCVLELLLKEGTDKGVQFRCIMCSLYMIPPAEYGKVVKICTELICRKWC